MRTLAALSLFWAISSTGTPAQAQCCSPYLGVGVAYQPIVQMQPVTVMRPQVVGYQPLATIPQRIHYRTPLRDFLFGRYRMQYIPIQIAPQSLGVPDHRHDDLEERIRERRTNPQRR